MNKNIILCSHSRLCEGMLDTLELFSMKNEHVFAVPFYTDALDGEQRLKEISEQISPEDITVIVTDVAFGSVNQIASRLFLDKPNFYLLSGMNLPMLMELSTLSPEDICEASLRECLKHTQENIIYVPDLMAEAQDGDE